MHSNAEVVLAVFRAIEERDREALFALYHDEVELYDAPSLPYGYEGVSGKEAVREPIYEVRDGKFFRAQMFHYDTAAIVAFLERAGSREPAAARIRDAGPAYT